MSDENRLTINCTRNDLKLFTVKKNIFIIDMTNYMVTSHNRQLLNPVHIDQFFFEGLNDLVEAAIFKYLMYKNTIKRTIIFIDDFDNSISMRMVLKKYRKNNVALLFDQINQPNKKPLTTDYSDSINLIDIPLMAISHQNEIITVNKAASELFQCPIRDIIGKKFEDLLQSADNQKHTYVKNQRDSHYFFINGNGEKKIIHVNDTASSYPMFDRVLLLEDVTKEYAYDIKLDYLSKHDKLTGVYNRGYFEEHFSVLDDEKFLPLGIMVIDINGLKILNDVFGHEEGDQLLRTASNVLEQCCGQEAVIGRTGGDEFIILLPNAPQKKLDEIKEQISRQCEKQKEVSIGVSMSIGLETKKYPYQNLDKKIKIAEEKMYKEKLQKSNQIKNKILEYLKQSLNEGTHETFEHNMRIRQLAYEVGKELNLSDAEIENLGLLALFHDIGKIRIPNEILNKEEKLTPKEWELIKTHAEAGYRIALAMPTLAPLAAAILHHHEHYDGSGYPDGLKGEDIPYYSRIIAVVDAYDAMTHSRSYQKLKSPMEALDELIACAGTQFDPSIVRVFVQIMKIKI
ncbi:sensor domain-containing diguanylate cyclase/phosphohydrolase [Vallitalea okinawensis]|uniref:sensor domain-containing diguanylate cyclase/phosphohydrolase n=1 Tax=Vallitalea okinawensis TaxID=2078660 RepID=UPI000CFAAC0C|nr:HD domain-containing phosphohydrolase [Vallitalea okinawensis]